MLHRNAHRFFALFLGVLSSAVAGAEPVAPAAVIAPGASASTTPQRSTEPAVQRSVIEDDHVRIDELKVRGQAQRISVVNKAADGSTLTRYEILTGDGGRDPSQGVRAAGQRVWQIFSF